MYCLFDIPLTSEPDFSLYFKNRENVRYGYRDSHPNRLWRFPPEAYIFTEYLKKKGINIEDKLDLTDKNIELSRNVMVNNFYMLDQNNIKFKMPKYKIFQPLMPKIDRDGLYSNYRWQLEYHCLVDKFFKPKLTLCLLLTKFFDFLHIKRRMR